MRRRLVILLLAAFWTFSPGTRAQPTGLSPDRYEVFELITRDEGLPGRAPSCATEDRDGFVWIGGREGFARYDGNGFKRFRRQEEDSTDVFDNRVTTLLAHDDQLWIGTHHGLFRMSLATERIVPVLMDAPIIAGATPAEQDLRVTLLYSDSDGRIWVSAPGHGFGYYDPDEDRIRFCRLDSAAIPAWHDDPLRLRNVLDFADDPGDPDILWLGTYGGMIRYNKRTGAHRVYYAHFPDKTERLARNSLRRILLHPNGMIYTGSWGNTWQVFNPVDGTLKPLPVLPEDVEEKPLVHVRRLLLDGKGQIWITSGFGLYMYDPETGRLTLPRMNDEDLGIYYGIDFQDRYDRIYVFRDDGMEVFDPRDQSFRSAPMGQITAAAVLPFGAVMDSVTNRLLVNGNSTNGLLAFDTARLDWHQYPIPRKFWEGPLVENVSSISPYGDGQYLVATSTHLLLFDVRTGLYRPLQVNWKLDRERFSNAFVDSRHRVWVATSDEGVRRWDPSTGQVDAFNVPSDPEFAAGRGYTFFEDSRQIVWIKCRFAISRILPLSDSLQHQPMPRYTAPFENGFVQDPYGRIWLGSLSGWVGRLSQEYPFTVDTLIELSNPERGIMTMLMDPLGFLWCLMPDEIVAIQTQSGGIRHFPLSKEVRDHALYNMERLPDGRFILFSRNKAYMFDPTTALRPFDPPQPYLTGIQIREAPMVSDSVARLLGLLDLKPFENFFSIHFSAIGLSLGQRFTFQYRLGGFQDKWVEAGDQRVANFTNVPSGDYVFELELVDVANGQVVASRTLPVRIAWHWWDHFWVKGLLAFLVLAFGNAVYRYRLQQVRREEKLKASFQEALAHAETDALRAQMNPHFIYNSLQAIENYILRHDAETAASYLNDFARLIRLILENARSASISLGRELETLGLYMQMEALRFPGKFEWRIRCDDSLSREELQLPPMLIQPFVENAIRHGLMPKPDTGLVEVSVTPAGEGMVKVTVEDNGIGRARSAEINARKNQGGHHSLGMAITADRLALLNARAERKTRWQVTDLMDAEGHPAGTRVELWIPASLSASAEKGE